MKGSRFLSIPALAFLLGSSVALFAQQPEEKPKEVEPPRQEEAKPPAHPNDIKPQQEQKPEDQTKDQMKEQVKKGQQDQKDQEKQDDRMKAAQHDEHGNVARPGGKSAHIPDDKFRAHFGRQHTFKVQKPVVVSGQTQFVYEGYTFVFADPWPVGWAYTDDCYVDYIDGEYFLFDLAHPGVRIALFVTL